MEYQDEPEDSEKRLLIQLMYRTNLWIPDIIESCPDYEIYDHIRIHLENNITPFHHIPNPSPGDINKFLKHKIKP
jgi:hypothetical protein